MQDETRNQRREIRRILKQAPKINQLTEDCGFDGKPENKYEEEDNQLLQ